MARYGGVHLIWLNNNGNILISGNSKVYNCSVCPCCDDDLRDAIRERQQASKLGSWSSWDSYHPTDVTKLIATCAQYTYTLTQLKAYVNAIAPWYLNGTWTGGSSTDLTKLSNTYANSATTYDELFALVKDMLTVVDPQNFGQHYSNKTYYGNGNDYDLATAVSKCQTDYHCYSTVEGVKAINCNILYTQDGDGFNRTSVGRRAVQFVEESLWTGVDKQLRFYYKFGTKPVARNYKNFGEVPAEGVWGLILNSGTVAAANSSYTASDYLPNVSFPTVDDWTLYLTGDGYGYSSDNWSPARGYHELIDWSFTHV